MASLERDYQEYDVSGEEPSHLTWNTSLASSVRRQPRHTCFLNQPIIGMGRENHFQFLTLAFLEGLDVKDVDRAKTVRINGTTRSIHDIALSILNDLGIDDTFGTINLMLAMIRDIVEPSWSNNEWRRVRSASKSCREYDQFADVVAGKLNIILPARKHI